MVETSERLHAQGITADTAYIRDLYLSGLGVAQYVRESRRLLFEELPAPVSNAYRVEGGASRTRKTTGEKVVFRSPTAIIVPWSILF